MDMAWSVLRSASQQLVAGPAPRDGGLLGREQAAQVEHAPIEALDVQNGANECWSSTEPDMYHLQESGASALAEPSAPGCAN